MRPEMRSMTNLTLSFKSLLAVKS